MRKYLIVLVMAIATIVFAPATAQAAEWYDSDINYHNRGPSGHDDDGRVRLSVWYNTDNDGVGYTIKRVRIDCWPDFAFEQSGNKVNGGSVTLQTGGNVVFFQSTSTDLGQNCEKNWYPDIHRGGSPSFIASYGYTARLDNWPDASDTLTMQCPCRPV